MAQLAAEPTAAPAGRSMVKIQPLPGMLTARTSPPFAATALRLIESPSPSPERLHQLSQEEGDSLFVSRGSLDSNGRHEAFSLARATARRGSAR